MIRNQPFVYLETTEIVYVEFHDSRLYRKFINFRDNYTQTIPAGKLFTVNLFFDCMDFITWPFSGIKIGFECRGDFSCHDAWKFHNVTVHDGVTNYIMGCKDYCLFNHHRRELILSMTDFVTEKVRNLPRLAKLKREKRL